MPRVARWVAAWWCVVAVWCGGRAVALVGTEDASQRTNGACCDLPAPRRLPITLERPVRMERPVLILDLRKRRTAARQNVSECDVPCEVLSRATDQAVDLVVAGQGMIPSPRDAQTRARDPDVAAASARSPMIYTAAASMESDVNYPNLLTVHERVDATLLTSLNSTVPVPYVRRSSIAVWGARPAVWTAERLREAFSSSSSSSSSSSHRRGQQKSDRPAAAFVARNCRSKNGREKVVKALHETLGVDRPSSCLKNAPWPHDCGGGGSLKGGSLGNVKEGNHLPLSLNGKNDAPGRERCSKHGVLRRYPFYLAFENSNAVDYVSEKVFDGLEAGVLPVYLGAPNVADFVPPHSVVDLNAFPTLDAAATYLRTLLDQPELYETYFDWKKRPLPDDFRQRWAFVGVHSTCRLCRWVYAHKFGFKWDKKRQQPDLAAGRTEVSPGPAKQQAKPEKPSSSEEEEDDGDDPERRSRERSNRRWRTHKSLSEEQKQALLSYAARKTTTGSRRARAAAGFGDYPLDRPIRGRGRRDSLPAAHAPVLRRVRPRVRPAEDDDDGDSGARDAK